jgi:hypothetical protein
MKPSRASVLGLVAVLVLPSLVLAVDPPPSGGYPNEVTALGENALLSQTTGEENTAVGFQALYSDTTGGANIAIGSDALYHNTTGTYNVAIGDNALVSNATGGGSVAIGYTALQAHSFSSGNVAVGFGAMSLGLTGTYNTAIGNVAMSFSTGSNNTAVGDGAMNTASGNSNVAIGRSAGLNFAGDNNIAIGQYAGQNITRGANNIEIGHQGMKKDANTIRLGDPAAQKKTFIAGISGTTMPDGVAVLINSKGQLGVATSSARYKEKIEPMDKASDALLSLHPVTFHYKKELDAQSVPQFGLVAEEVAKVDPDLVVRDESGQPYTVRYEAVNAMLLNEFLKEHRKVESLEAKLARLEATVQRQSALIEKVSAQQAAVRSSTRLVSANE